MGGHRMIHILVLTSSRADFGIYLPVLKLLKNDSAFNLKILAFGTHLSREHGYTIDNIREAGFDPEYTIESMSGSDTPLDIANVYALTASKFADFWNRHNKAFTYVLVLGDRYEMAAAVAAGIPFGIPFVHIHAGETTLGAIDNIYRHSITLASVIQFVSMPAYRDRVRQILGNEDKCYISGAPSIDNLAGLELMSTAEFYERWHIDLQQPFILVTIHPETIDYESNEIFAGEMLDCLGKLALGKQIVITMPNADTGASVFRAAFRKLAEENKSSVHLVENFGTQSYFTCMKYAGLMIGNTSSGIIEAASFGCYVLNLGNRQAGRTAGENVIHLPFDSKSIIKNTELFFGKTYSGGNIYGKGNAATIIIENLKANAL